MVLPCSWSVGAGRAGVGAAPDGDAAPTPSTLSSSITNCTTIQLGNEAADGGEGGVRAEAPSLFDETGDVEVLANKLKA